jgi:hypothetical protein
MKPMREEYDLKAGRPNPYARRFGTKGGRALLKWWSRTTANVRVLSDSLSREFPDAKSTNDALRLVVKLRASKPKQEPRRTRRAASR